MDKLTTVQQQQVRKMSNERLRVKLISAGYDEESVLETDRDNLIATYAEVLASGKFNVAPVGYDPDLEREKLAFERQKWERELEERKRKEEMDHEERKRTQWLEDEERKRRQWIENEQLDLRRRELERQLNRDKAEDERRDSAVTKGKLFGDAMRASAIRMGSDPIDAIPFFSEC